MTIMQAADATALVRESVQGAVDTYLKEIAPYIRESSEMAVNFLTADVHPNPDVMQIIKEKFTSLGYSLSFSEDKLKISWGK